MPALGPVASLPVASLPLAPTEVSIGGVIALGGAARPGRTVNISGVLAASGIINRRIPKALSGSVTPSGAVTRLRVKVIDVVGSIAVSGALVKVPAKGL